MSKEISHLLKTCFEHFSTDVNSIKNLNLSISFIDMSILLIVKEGCVQTVHVSKNIYSGEKCKRINNTFFMV